MFLRTSVGVEIAGQDLRVAVIREIAGKRTLLRLETLTGFVGMPEDERGKTLAAFAKKCKITGAKAFLTLPNACGVVRDLEFPVEVGGKLRSAVGLQVENLSPWTSDEIYWDCAYELPKKGSRTIIAHVSVIPRTVLDSWIQLFRSAGLPLKGASLSSLSWAHGASALWAASAQPTMIFDVETDYVEGALVRSGRLHAITTQGADADALLQSSASQLLRAGRVDTAEDIRIIVQGVANAGADAAPVRLPIDAAPAHAPKSFGAIASALLGTASTAFRSNLIPVPLRHRASRVQWIPTYALGTLLLALAIAAWAREPYQQLLYAEQLDGAVRRLAPEVRSVADQEKQLNRLSDRLKTLDALMRARDANLEALRELAKILPPEAWINSYQYQDGVLTISGYGSSAAALQKLIEDSPIFRDAQFASSITRDPSGKDRFTIRTAIEAAR
jgi:Tfp pilus assembly protein PilN